MLRHWQLDTCKTVAGHPVIEKHIYHVIVGSILLIPILVRGWDLQFRSIPSYHCSFALCCRKHCIEQEKQWDFLKELTAKISDVVVQEDNEEATAPKGKKRGRWAPRLMNHLSCSVVYFQVFNIHLFVRWCVCVCVCHRKRQTSPPPATSRYQSHPIKKKCKAVAPASTDGKRSGSSDEDSASTSDQLAGRGMFSQYFKQPSSSSGSSSKSNSVARWGHIVVVYGFHFSERCILSCNPSLWTVYHLWVMKIDNPNPPNLRLLLSSPSPPTLPASPHQLAPPAPSLPWQQDFNISQEIIQ